MKSYIFSFCALALLTACVQQPVEEADVAIVFIDSPNSGYGHYLPEALDGDASSVTDYLVPRLKAALHMDVPEGKENETVIKFLKSTRLDHYFTPEGSEVSAPGNGYYPISLQYEDYVADLGRAESIGQGDPKEKNPNRSYKGKGVKTFNAPDLELVRQMRQQMGEKKVIVVINTTNPTVLSEIEPLADAILISFQVQKQAILEIINGSYEPSALLPFQMPANMNTVETQAEDTPRDMDCYRDADGHVYDFAFGMNWSGVIDDARVKKYK